MKKYILPSLILSILLPTIAFATTAVPWIQKNLTDTFMYPNSINGNNLRLLVGTTTQPTTSTYNDLADFASSTNDFLSIGTWNYSSGSCATAELDANNNLSTLTNHFTALGITGGSFTGSGCTNTPYTGFGADSTYLINPNGNMNFALGTSSPTATFNWYGNGYAPSNTTMTLLQNGNLGIGTTSPFAKLSVATLPGATGSQLTLFAIASSTANATTTAFSVDNQGNTTVLGTLLDVGNFLQFGTSGNGGSISVPSGGIIRLGSFTGSTATSLLVGTTDGVVGIRNRANTLDGTLNTGILYASATSSVGTSTPFAEFAIATPNGSNGSLQTLFAIASSTQQGATTTLLSLSSTGLLQFGGNSSAVPALKMLGNLLAVREADDSADASFRALNYASVDGRFTGSSGSVINLSIDGNAKLSNNAANDFSRLQFGGTTNAFPSLNINTGTQAVTVGLANGALGGKFGVGTSTPLGKLSVHLDNGETNVNALVIASSTSSATSTLYSIDNRGQHIFGGPAPSCGTGCSSVVGNDNGGTITTSAAATAVTLNFANAWKATPVCTISDNSTAITGDISAISATSFTASFSVGLTGIIYYQCAVYGN